jgi:hypothetical protein
VGSDVAMRVGQMRWQRGLCVHQCEAVGQGLGQKPETKRLWLSFGGAVWNGSVESWWEVVGAV